MSEDDQQEQHLADLFDRATAIEMEATEKAIREVQTRCRQKQTPGPRGDYPELDCEECGNEIGEERLKVAIQNHLCIYCATAAERKRR